MSPSGPASRRIAVIIGIPWEELAIGRSIFVEGSFEESQGLSLLLLLPRSAPTLDQSQDGLVALLPLSQDRLVD
jgi:hypothetical protein